MIRASFFPFEKLVMPERGCQSKAAWEFIFRTDVMFLILKFFFTVRQPGKKWIAMKRYAFIVLSAIILGSCITGRGPGDDSIRKELYSVRREISMHTDGMSFLKDRRVGETGYFYIISKQGIVIYHPNQIIIGRSFNGFDFIRQIIEKQEGVLRYSREGLNYRIYFAPMDNDNILCLSIPENEIKS